jgi:hypothetical protein
MGPSLMGYSKDVLGSAGLGLLAISLALAALLALRW